MSGPPMIDGAFARWLADRAGQALLGLRAEMGFADAGALKSAGDKVSHDLIRTELARWRPGDAVLSEEDEGSRLAWAAEVNAGAVSRLTADRVWIIDPLDGTREFSEEGRADWAVHVALWARNAATSHGLVAGAVGLPAQHRVLGTDLPPGLSADDAGGGDGGWRGPVAVGGESQPAAGVPDRSRRGGWGAAGADGFGRGEDRRGGHR